MMNRFIIYCLIIFGVCIVSAPSTYAQTAFQPVTNTEANQFFEQCVAHPHPAMNIDSQLYYCGCASVKVKQQLTAKDIADLKSRNAIARLEAQKRMMTYVQAPCLEAPMEYYMQKSCREDAYLTSRTDTPGQLCECITKRSLTLIKRQGVFIMEEALRRTVQPGDAFLTLLQSSAFQGEMDTIRSLCLRLHKPDIDPPAEFFIPEGRVAPLVDGSEDDEDNHRH